MFRSTLVKVIVAVALIIAVGAAVDLSWLRKAISFFTLPLFKTAVNLPGDDINQLKQENEELKEKLSTLLVDYAQLKYLEKENELLRQELGFVKRNNYDFVAADITAKTDIPTGANIYFLNKGIVDGVKEGMPVVVADGILIGKIIKAEKYTSQWLPLNNNNSLVSAIIFGKESASGLVRGDHNLSLIMEYVSRDNEVSEGDLVVTSGREEFIPAGLVIGQVVKVNRRDDKFFQTIQISSPVDWGDLTKVVIIKGANAKNQTE